MLVVAVINVTSFIVAVRALVVLADSSSVHSRVVDAPQPAAGLGEAETQPRHDGVRSWIGGRGR